MGDSLDVVVAECLLRWCARRPICGRAPGAPSPPAKCSGRLVTITSRRRGLDAFGNWTEILCPLTKARCEDRWNSRTVTAPREGKGKNVTCDFGPFPLTPMRKMPVKRAGEILGGGDTRLWRMLMAHVRDAHASADFSKLVYVGLDAMNRHKGHNNRPCSPIWRAGGSCSRPKARTTGCSRSPPGNWGVTTDISTRAAVSRWT